MCGKKSFVYEIYGDSSEMDDPKKMKVKGHCIDCGLNYDQKQSLNDINKNIKIK